MRSNILPSLAVLVSILIFFGYTKPIYTGSLKGHQIAIESATKALAAAANYVERANALTAEEAAMDQVALARLEVMLPDSVSNIRTILDLDALAARSGVALSSVDISETSAEKISDTENISASPIASVELSVSGKGTYAAFQRFLAGIETSERLLDVTDVAITGSDTGVYTYQLTVRLYWLR